MTVEAFRPGLLCGAATALALAAVAAGARAEVTIETVALRLILDSKLTLRVVELADINGLRLSFPYT